MSTEAPHELFLTFEDGLHVGVFHDVAKAEELNDLRRRKKRVNPVTVRYVRSDIIAVSANELMRAVDHSDIMDIKRDVRALEARLRGATAGNNPFVIACPHCQAKAGESCISGYDTDKRAVVYIPRPYHHSERSR